MKIKRFSIYTKRCLIGTLFSVGLFFGCNPDEPPIPPDEPVSPGDVAIVTTVKNADGQTSAYYLQRVSVGNTESVDNSRATELGSGTSGITYSFGGNVYFSDYIDKKTIQKWTIDENNSAEMTGEMNVQELGFPSIACFKDESTAFVGGVSGNIVIFNPKTMKKMGTIDISAQLRVGEETDFPEEGSAIGAEVVSEMIVRDRHLFASIMSFSNLEKFIPGDAGCSIVVIDLDKVDVNSSGNTGAVIERIYDERGSATGAWNSGGGSRFMKMDERNDIYVHCHNGWAGSGSLFKKPACILKIADGETDFDENYYFDLERVAKGSGQPVLGMEYYGNGKFLAVVQDPAAIDPENVYSFYTDPIYQWWSFDLYDKSAKMISERYTFGASASVCFFQNEYGYIPFGDKTESYVLKVNPETLESSKQFGTEGLPAILRLD